MQRGVPCPSVVPKNAIGHKDTRIRPPSDPHPVENTLLFLPEYAVPLAAGIETFKRPNAAGMQSVSSENQKEWHRGLSRPRASFWMGSSNRRYCFPYLWHKS